MKTIFHKIKNNLVVRNGIFNLGGFIVPMLLYFVFTPRLVKLLGDEGYGLWTINISVLGLVAVSQFGLGFALPKYIAEYRAKKDIEGLSATITMGFLLFSLIGLSISVILYIASPLIAAYLTTDIIGINEIIATLKLTALGYMPFILINAGLAIPVGLQRYEIPMIFGVLRSSLTLGLAYIIARLGGTVYSIVFCTVTIQLLLAILSIGVGYFICANIGVHWIISKFHLRQLLSFMFYVGIASIGVQIFSSLDRIVVGNVLGISSVTYYAVCGGIANKIESVSDVLSRALMPITSSFSVEIGSKEKILNFFKRSYFVMILISFSLGISLLLFSDPILRLWMGVNFYREAITPFRILIIVYTFTSLYLPAFHIANGIGLVKINAIGTLGGGSLTIILIYLLGGRFGLNGAAFANFGYIFTYFIIIGVYMHINKPELNRTYPNNT